MIDFRIQRSWSRDGYDVWVIERQQNGKSYIAEPIILKFIDMGDGACRLPEPTLQVDGILGREIIDAARKAFAGMEWFNKDEMSVNAKIQKAMQDHIDSLKLVVDRTIK